MSAVQNASVPEIFTDAGTLNLRGLFLELWQRRWWIIASVVLFTALFTSVALLMKPVYRTSTVLIPVDPNSLAGSMGSALGQISGLAALAGVSLGDGNTAATQEALAVLQSRQFIERFITDMNLMGKLYSKQWNATTGEWRVPPEERPTITRAYKYFQRISKVTQDKKTGLVTLAVEWTDPEEGALWTNELVKRLNAEMRGRAMEKAEASVAFLEKELALTSLVETRLAINRLIEAQIKQRMLASVSEESAFRVVDRALPPERDDPVRPKKIILIPLGPIIGLVMGMIAVLLINWIRDAMAVAGRETIRR